MSNPLSSVLGWLHAGYPEGVPPKDFYPLLALLSRTLDDGELQEVVGRVIRENPDGDIRARDVEQALAEVTDSATPVRSEDVNAVAARLAKVGWPLAPSLGDEDQVPAAGNASADEDQVPAAGSSSADGAGPLPQVPDDASELDHDPAQGPNLVQRIDDWLAKGFPSGVPRQDRVPLLALLGPRLTDAQVDEIARRLVTSADRSPDEEITSEDASALISGITRDDPTPAELERVAAELAAKGWPLRA